MRLPRTCAAESSARAAPHEAERPAQRHEQEGNGNDRAGDLHPHNEERIVKIHLRRPRAVPVIEGRDDIVDEGEANRHDRGKEYDEHDALSLRQLFGKPGKKPEHDSEKSVINEVQDEHIGDKPEHKAAQQRKGYGDQCPAAHAENVAIPQKERSDDLHPRYHAQGELTGDEKSRHQADKGDVLRRSKERSVLLHLLTPDNCRNVYNCSVLNGHGRNALHGRLYRFTAVGDPVRPLHVRFHVRIERNIFSGSRILLQHIFL